MAFYYEAPAPAPKRREVVHCEFYSSLYGVQSFSGADANWQKLDHDARMAVALLQAHGDNKAKYLGTRTSYVYD